MQRKLERLRADYSQVRGYPFSYFFCPILFKDEDVPLCKGHIINLAFANSSRFWTVQRKDVDNFFGSYFEADFTNIQYKESLSARKALTDRTLSKKLHPRILVNGKSVDYFPTRGPLIPPVSLEIDDNGRKILFGLKMSAGDAIAAVGQKWDIDINNDLRVTAVVSLIKAAHLTLFELLGYRYALSAGGHYVGWDILGNFFSQNHDKSKSDILNNALPFFSEFANMVRPLGPSSHKLQGTITDGLLLVCGLNSRYPWALIVFVKVSQSLNAVMIPIFDQPEKVRRFLDFQRDGNESIEATWCRLEENQWKAAEEPNKVVWPKRGTLYP